MDGSLQERCQGQEVKIKWLASLGIFCLVRSSSIVSVGPPMETYVLRRCQSEISWSTGSWHLMIARLDEFLLPGPDHCSHCLTGHLCDLFCYQSGRVMVPDQSLIPLWEDRQLLVGAWIMVIVLNDPVQWDMKKPVLAVPCRTPRDGIHIVIRVYLTQ